MQNKPQKAQAKTEKTEHDKTQAIKNAHAKCVKCAKCKKSCTSFLQSCDEAKSARGFIEILYRVACDEVSLEEAKEVFYSCFNCGNCELTCPYNLHVGALIEGLEVETINSEDINKIEKTLPKILQIELAKGEDKKQKIIELVSKRRFLGELKDLDIRAKTN